MGEPTGTGPVTATPDMACEVLVDVELDEDVDDAVLGDPPHATRTMLRLRTVATHSALRPQPPLLQAPRPTIASSVMTSAFVGTARLSLVIGIASHVNHPATDWVPPHTGSSALAGVRLLSANCHRPALSG